MFEGDPDYEKIKSELDPLITKLYTMGKGDPKYVQFKGNLEEWYKRFSDTIETTGTVESIQQFQIRIYKQLKEDPSKRRLLTVLGLFRYLGLVESIGALHIDLLILLLVANGKHFHVEREHDVPRIVHATYLKDLRRAHLGSKIEFLKRNNLAKTSQMVDVDLRNSIAHLDLKIDAKGKVSAKSRGKRKREIDIFQRLNEFSRKFMMISLILTAVHKLMQRGQEKKGNDLG